MKIRDAQVTAALAAWEGQPTRVEAMRAALEAATVLIPEPEYEYGYRALGQATVPAPEDYARDAQKRWGDKLMRRIRTDWEEVEE